MQLHEINTLYQSIRPLSNLPITCTVEFAKTKFISNRRFTKVSEQIRYKAESATLRIEAYIYKNNIRHRLQRRYELATHIAALGSWIYIYIYMLERNTTKYRRVL